MRKLWPLVYFALALLLFGQSITHGFVWDDEEQVVKNPLIQSLENIPKFYTGSSFASGGGGLQGIYYKPLMTTTYSVLWNFFPGQPSAFHLFQILLHAANAVMLGLFFLRFFPRAVALSLPLIFLVHPLNVECAIYIADLQDTMYFFFGISALLAFAYLPRNWKRGAAVCALLLLSLLCKESGILFVAATFALSFTEKNFKKKELLFSVAALGIYLFMRLGLADLAVRSGNLQPITRADLPTRFMTMPKILAFYVTNFFLPRDLAISQHWLVTEFSWDGFFGPLLIDVCFFSALVAVAFRLRKAPQAKTLFFFLFCALIGFGLHAQIFPLDLTIADRWFYFTMMGVLGVIACVVSPLLTNRSAFPVLGPRLVPALGVLLALIVCGLSARSYLRHDNALNPEAFDLQNNYGVELFRTGQPREAGVHFEESVKLAPYWWSNWNNLGAVYERFHDEKQAEECYRRAIANGHYYLAYENLASLLVRQGRMEEAKTFLNTEALILFPGNAKLLALAQMVNST